MEERKNNDSTAGQEKNNYIIVSDDQGHYSKLNHFIATPQSSHQSDLYNKLEHFQHHNTINSSSFSTGDYDHISTAHDQSIDGGRDNNHGKRVFNLSPNCVIPFFLLI